MPQLMQTELSLVMREDNYVGCIPWLSHLLSITKAESILTCRTDESLALWCILWFSGWMFEKKGHANCANCCPWSCLVAPLLSLVLTACGQLLEGCADPLLFDSPGQRGNWRCSKQTQGRNLLLCRDVCK